MNQSFYIGAVGAHQQQKRLDVQSNNIANVNTYGFKAENARFKNLLYTGLRTTEGEDLSGTGGALLGTATDFTQGTLHATGGAQDYMIEGSGFFALLDLATQQVSLTRNGAFMVGALEEADGSRNFYLTDGAGRMVLDSNMKPIRVEDSDAQQPVGIFDYINYNGMQHTDGTRFLAVDKNGGIIALSGEEIEKRLNYRCLESSNVDLANELTKVIESQRLYSVALRMVTASDEIESSIIGMRN